MGGEACQLSIVDAFGKAGWSQLVKAVEKLFPPPTAFSSRVIKVGGQRPLIEAPSIKAGR